MPELIPAAPGSPDVPRKTGTCEYCLRETTVYAYVLWTCRRCLESDPNA